jgi:hypothetical protein
MVARLNKRPLREGSDGRRTIRLAAIRQRAPQASADGRDDGGAGVDLAAAVRTGDGFVKARANCRECKDEEACRAWLLAQAGEPAEFCANRAFFAALKSEK